MKLIKRLLLGIVRSRVGVSVGSASASVGRSISKAEKEAEGYWKKLGPGLTTGAADDDPSGIATYSQVGAQYGNMFGWMAIFTYPFMSVVQFMCAKIGLVTSRGLAANIRMHYPRWILYVLTIMLFAANAFNIGADLGAMAEATKLVFPSLSFTWLVIHPNIFPNSLARA